MPNIHKIETVSGITTIKFTKKPTYQDLRQAIDDIEKNFNYELRLWDFSNIKFNFSNSEIKSIAAYGKMKFTKPNKMAIVAPDDLAFGEMRVFEVHRAQENSSARVFRTKHEAIMWLTQD